jgi:glycosyltransferase involved in cell wall biosynthesis
MAVHASAANPNRPRNGPLAPLRAVAGRLRRWWLGRGLEHVRFHGLPAARNTAPAAPLVFPAPDASLGPGVNLIGYLYGQFGLGQAARMYARALLAEGYPVAPTDAGIAISHACGDQSLAAVMGQGTPFATNLVFVNPDLFGKLAPRLGEGTYTIGFWFWELDMVPQQWQAALDLVDEVWVSTRFVEEAFMRATNKPVVRIPYPILPQQGAEISRASFGLDPDAFIFLCSFDFNSSIHRKNPWAVVDAFKRAFVGTAENVQLVLKCSNGFRHPELLRGLLAHVAEDARILVRDQVLDDEQLHALQDAADAYVSLHRAEGLGLGMAESMARGKPVIATAWSGNLDFMNDGNSCLVPYEMVPITPGQYPYVTEGTWAEADVGAAAAWMRRLVAEPALARRIGAQAQSDVLSNMSPQAAAQAMRARLQSLEAQASMKLNPTSAGHEVSP